MTESSYPIAYPRRRIQRAILRIVGRAVLPLLTRVYPNGFADVLAAASQVGADTVIDLGGGDTITLAGVARADLDPDDFLF